jgi:hypothetical protein
MVRLCSESWKKVTDRVTSWPGVGSRCNTCAEKDGQRGASPPTLTPAAGGRGEERRKKSRYSEGGRVFSPTLFDEGGHPTSRPRPIVRATRRPAGARRLQAPCGPQPTLVRPGVTRAALLGDRSPRGRPLPRWRGAGRPGCPPCGSGWCCTGVRLRLSPPQWSGLQEMTGTV